MDDDYTEDVMVWPTMKALLACGEQELVNAKRPVGRSTIQYGADVPALDPLDGDCDGFLWVRLIDGFPAAQFPNQDFAPSPNGVRMAMAFSLEVAVARCLNTQLDDEGRIFGLDGQPLTPATIFEDARAQMADMAALRRAICKCLRASETTFILGNLASAAPSGLTNYTGWVVTVYWDPDAD